MLRHHGSAYRTRFSVWFLVTVCVREQSHHGIVLFQKWRSDTDSLKITLLGGSMYVIYTYTSASAVGCCNYQKAISGDNDLFVRSALLQNHNSESWQRLVEEVWFLMTHPKIIKAGFRQIHTSKKIIMIFYGNSNPHIGPLSYFFSSWDDSEGSH